MKIVENELWINWPHGVVQLTPTVGPVEPIIVFFKNVVTRNKQILNNISGYRLDSKDLTVKFHEIHVSWRLSELFVITAKNEKWFK